jgi:predicted nucleotidyltransferase
MLFGSHAKGDADDDSDVDVAVFVGKEDIGKNIVRDAVADTAYGQIINGFDVSALTLPDDYLEPVEGCFRSELARRIAREGVDI